MIDRADQDVVGTHYMLRVSEICKLPLTRLYGSSSTLAACRWILLLYPLNCPAVRACSSLSGWAAFAAWASCSLSVPACKHSHD